MAATDLGKPTFAKGDQVDRSIGIQEPKDGVGDSKIVYNRCPTEMSGSFHGHGCTTGRGIYFVHSTEVEAILKERQKLEDVALVGSLAAETHTRRLAAREITRPISRPRSLSPGR